MKPMRLRIKEHLAKVGAQGPGAIAEELGDKPRSVSKALSRMVADGELVRDDKFGVYILSERAMRDPESAHCEPVAKAPVRRDQSVPTWTPGIDYDRDGGELRTPATPILHVGENTQPVDPDEAALFTQFGLDPAKWEITNLRRSQWQKYDGEWLEAFRATFAPRSAEVPVLSEEETRDFLASYRETYGRPEHDSGTWMVPVGDLQLGKPDGGGTAGIVERFARGTEAVRADLERRGGVDRLILPWLGDCIEGLVSQRGRNIARLDRTVTEQVRTLRRLKLHQIATLSPLAREVLIIVLGGNHDETIRDQNMEPRDSWAIDAGAAVADALALTDDFNHVKWLFPEPEELGVTVNVGTEQNPYVIHFTHGHVARSPAKMLDWWASQAHGRQSAGAADLLVTAHFHHFRAESSGGNKSWLQIPALDGGSDYFRRRSGEESPAGMVQLRLTGPGRGPGWSDLTIHG